MTAYRATDLTYGQVGELTYHTNDKTWCHARGLNNDRDIQPLYAPRQQIPPALERCDEQSESAKDRRNAHKRRARWLRDHLPQAQCFASTLVNAGKEPTQSQVCASANLLSLGRTSDIHHKSDKSFVLAFPTGSSAHVLRIIQPRLGYRQWPGHPSPKLSILDTSTFEDAYWIGKGGPILQVMFAMDETKESSWLAVRKAEYTIILRPFYNMQKITPASVDSGISHDYPPSRLACNPVLTITRQQTGSFRHADIAFNPWYIRQFAVVDESGHWTIWNIEGKARKVAVAGKSGNLGKSATTHLDSNQPEISSAWARITWVSDLRTIVVCNRLHIAAFDLSGSDIVEMSCPKLFQHDSSERILDIKRNSTSLAQFVVLTSKRVFWLEVSHSSVPQDERCVSVILSYRHYRDHDDDSMKITYTNVKGDSTILVYSDRDPSISTFSLSSSSNDTPTRSCDASTFTPLSSAIDDSSCKVGRSLCILPAHLLESPNRTSAGPGSDYIRGQVEFMQMFSLSSNLSLSEVLCSISSKKNPTIAPSISIPRRKLQLSSKQVLDDFIVSDDTENDVDLVQDFKGTQGTSIPRLANRTRSFNAREIHDLGFPQVPAEILEHELAKDHVEVIINALKRRITNNIQGSVTAFDEVSDPSHRIDIDVADMALREFIRSSAELEDVESLFTLTISLIDGGLSSVSVSGATRNLLDIYDNLVQMWVSPLADHVSSRIRIAKDKQIRSAAIDLYLGSLVVGLNYKSHDVAVADDAELNPLSQNTLDYLRQDSQPIMLSQYTSTPADSLPTPTPTASIASRSQVGGTSEVGHGEDTTIANLRNYALSVKDQPLLSGPADAILKQWTLGTDASTFNWHETRAAVVNDVEQDGNAEDVRRNRKEELRRRRRMDKMLKKQREQDFLSASQPAIFGSQPLPDANSQPDQFSGGNSGIGVGSQPDTRTFVDSQGPEDISMTQPMSGLFGSRASKGSGKPKKKRIKGF